MITFSLMLSALALFGLSAPAANSVTSTAVKRELAPTVDVWDGATATPFEGEGTKANPYLIMNGENLKHIANEVNAAKGESYAGKYFKMVNDIDLGSHAWTPIGTNFTTTYGPKFGGHFDGNNKSILNLKIDKSIKPAGVQYFHVVGLFGYVTANGSLSNLTVKGEVEAEDRVGGLTYYTLGPVTNCTSYVNIKLTGTKDVYTGGIAGYSSKVTFKDCANYGSITTTREGTKLIGGIVGNASGTKVINCVNHGDITVKNGSVYTAGIVGKLYSGSYFEGGANYGTIKGYSNVGGLVGYFGEKSTGKFETAIMAGEVTGVELVTPYIAFNGNISVERYFGDKLHSVSSVIAGASYLAPAGTVEGRKFNGWYKDAALTERYTPTNITGSKNDKVKLYGRFALPVADVLATIKATDTCVDYAKVDELRREVSYLTDAEQTELLATKFVDKGNYEVTIAQKLDEMANQVALNTNNGTQIATFAEFNANTLIVTFSILGVAALCLGFLAYLRKRKAN